MLKKQSLDLLDNNSCLLWDKNRLGWQPVPMAFHPQGRENERVMKPRAEIARVQQNSQFP